MRPRTLRHRLLCSTPKARFFPTLNSIARHGTSDGVFTSDGDGSFLSLQPRHNVYGIDPLLTLNGRGSWTPAAWCSVTALKHHPVPARCWERPESTPPWARCLTHTATGRLERQVVTATSGREGPRGWQVRHQRAQVELREESRRGWGGGSKAELCGKGEKCSAF